MSHEATSKSETQTIVEMHVRIDQLHAVVQLSVEITEGPDWQILQQKLARAIASDVLQSLKSRCENAGQFALEHRREYEALTHPCVV